MLSTKGPRRGQRNLQIFQDFFDSKMFCKKSLYKLGIRAQTGLPKNQKLLNDLGFVGLDDHIIKPICQVASPFILEWNREGVNTGKFKIEGQFVDFPGSHRKYLEANRIMRAF